MEDILFENRIATPRWIKITKLNSDFPEVATTSTKSLYTLPIKGIVHATQIIPRVAFSGGTIASYTISIGITGTLAKYAVATSVFTGFTVGQPTVLPLYLESTSATTDIKVTATSIGGNLDTASVGTVDIYLLISTLP